MTLQSWRQILLLVLWDMLCRFLNDPVTQISKLRKIMKNIYPVKRYNVLEFEFCYWIEVGIIASVKPMYHTVYELLCK